MLLFVCGLNWDVGGGIVCLGGVDLDFGRVW